MSVTLTLGQLAEHLTAQCDGDPHITVCGVADLAEAEPSQLSFFVSPRYRSALENTRAAAVLIQDKHRKDCKTAALVVADPYLAYAKAAALLHPVVRPEAGVHASAVVAENASIAKSASIGPYCVIGRGVHIAEEAVIEAGVIIGERCTVGRQSWLKPRVTLVQDVILGERVLIHTGAVIGSDGFGFADDKGKWVKIPQLGRVCIGNDVEIGANTTIDRGAIRDTVIEDGVKLDNQIQMGHNVHIGAHTIIAGCVGIAGSTHIGKHCAIGGAVMIGGHLTIADDVKLTLGSTVLQNINQANVYSSGLTVQEGAGWKRNLMRLYRLDRLFEEVRHLQQTMQSFIKSKGNHDRTE